MNCRRNGVLTVRSQVTHHNLPPTHYLAWSWSVRRNKKYFLQFGYKYPLQVTEIYFAIQTNTFCNMVKYFSRTTYHPHYLTWSWSVRENKTWQNYPLWNTKRQTSVAGSVMRLKLEGHDIHNLKPRKHHDYILSVLV